MPEDNKPLSEYAPDSGTTSEQSTSYESEEKLIPPSEYDRYISGKPFRKTITAKIVDDQNKKN